MSEYRVLEGDCLETLKSLPDQSVHTCVSSPPYFGLRDYGTGTWTGGDIDCDHVSHEIRTGQGMAAFSENLRGGGHKAGSPEKVIQFRDVCGKCGAERTDQQIGLEPTPEEFIEALVRVFCEVRRVLRDDGTLWLNLGDSYASRPNGSIGKESRLQGAYTSHTEFRRAHARRKSTQPDGYKHKDLMGMPWRVAFALQADGWYLRQDIIWNKPNPMPESVRDRCTKAHEYVFLLSKGPRYFYDHEAVKEPATMKPQRRSRRAKYEAPGAGEHRKGTQYLRDEIGLDCPDGKRNRRSVWTVTTRPYKGAHFATFPPDLIEPCILAGTSERGHCPECGERWVRQVDKSTSFEGSSARAGRSPDQINGSGKHIGGVNGGNRNLKSGPVITSQTIGWKPGCECGHEPVPDVVLDPFGGSGTTAGVALAHGRDAILCELNPDSVALVPDRVQWVLDFYEKRRRRPANDNTPPKKNQLALF